MTFDVRRLDSLTKYPSIPTWHDFDKGATTPEIDPETKLFVTEKVDGTNGRIVRLGGQWWIGSRDRLLARNDGGFFYKGPENPLERAIVDTLRPIAERTVGMDHVTAWYFEVFGDGIGASCKEYARRGGQVSCRLFDHAVIANSAEIMAWPPEKIAGWRQRGGQTFDTVEDLSTQLSGVVALVPYLSSVGIHARDLPRSISDGRPFIERWVGRTTRVKLDEEALGRTEGVVVRTGDRKRIWKLRLEDYDKAMRKRFVGYDPQRHAEFVWKEG